MPDLNQRLRGVDRVSVPDLWGRARELAEHASADRAVESRPRRLVVAIIALVIAAAGFAVVLAAFNGRGGAPVGPGPQRNGVIATVEHTAPHEGNTDIVAIDPSTGRQIDLTPGLDSERSPVWSPDGTRVAFLRTSASSKGRLVVLHEGLFVMNADGSGLREVYPCASSSQCEVRAFAWAPDDEHLAWTLERSHKDGGAVVQILDLTSGTVTEVCAHFRCGQSLGQLAWSPDSSRLAFTDGAGAVLGLVGPPASSIWTVDADGSHLTRLTKGTICNREHTLISDCFADTWPAWSPDGRTLAFLHERADTEPLHPAGPAELIRMSPDGSNQRVTRLCQDASTCDPSAPQWSPGGSSILLATGVEGGSRIRLVDLSSGAVSDVAVQPTAACEDPVTPSWSPDGKQVAFIGGPGKVDNLCAVPAEGGVARVLVPHLIGTHPSAGSGFTWLPAGAIDTSSAQRPASPTTEVQQTIVINQGVPNGTDRITFAPPAPELAPGVLTSNRALAIFAEPTPASSRSRP